MAARRQREEKEEKDVYQRLMSELLEPHNLSITPEERLTMRNIPFFVLPQHETIPRTDHIGAKVNTRNTRYSPEKPVSLVVLPTKPADYSHVKAKVYSGRKHSDTAGVVANTGRSTTRTYHSTPSLHKSGPILRSQRSVSTSQLPPRPATASKYKSVKARVGSLDNISHTPGGGSKVREETVSASKSRGSKASSHIHSQVVRPTTESTCTVQRLKSTKEIRSRIDTRDPNPAHKLKRSLEELTLSHGTKINPRFAETKKHPSQILRRFSSIDLHGVERKAGTKPLRKSVTIGAIETFTTTPAKFLSELESLSEQSKDMANTAIAPMVDGPKRWIMDENGVSTVQPTLNCIQEDDIEVTNTDTDTTVFLKNILSRSSLTNPAESTQEQQDDIEVTNTDTDTTVFLKNILSRSSLTNPAESTQGDVSVQDIEMNSTESDTTVYPLLTGDKGVDPSLDEGEVGYYEVAQQDASLIAASALTFPHGIPRLCVLDERDELLEVIVDPPHSLTYPPPPHSNNEPSTRL